MSRLTAPRERTGSARWPSAANQAQARERAPAAAAVTLSKPEQWWLIFHVRFRQCETSRLYNITENIHVIHIHRSL